MQTIEKTGKGLKAWILVGGTMTLVGIAGVVWSISHSIVPMPWVILAVAGFAIYLLTRILIWWNHG